MNNGIEARVNANVPEDAVMFLGCSAQGYIIVGTDEDVVRATKDEGLRDKLLGFRERFKKEALNTPPASDIRKTFYREALELVIDPEVNIESLADGSQLKAGFESVRKGYERKLAKINRG